MRQLLIVFSIVFFSVTLYAFPKDDKKKTEDETVAPVFTEGIVYSLPRTGIRIYVEAEKKIRIAGPYALYAQKYMGIENAPTGDSEKWEIKMVYVKTFAVPDPKQVYKGMGETAALLNLTGSGILAGINTNVEIVENLPPTNNLITDELSSDFPFTDLSMWGMFTKADSTNKYKLVPKSVEEKAAEAAETIYTLRNARFRLLTNADDEPFPDGKSFEVMTRELGNIEKEQLALFIGKTAQKTYKYCFDFIPGDNDVKGEVVFRFSESRGVLPKTDLTGKPVIVDILKESNLENQQKKQVASENPDAGKSGIYYRMPGQAVVNVSNGVNLLASTRITIAQFGTVAPLPENLLDGNYRLEFHSETGAVKSVTEF